MSGTSLLLSGLKSHFSSEALRLLSEARIGIAGAGGLGSNVAMLLARTGVRHFVVADHDRVEASNLNRQWFWPEDVGKSKVGALQERIHELDSGIICEMHEIFLYPESACELFAGCGIVVEAFDNARDKAELCSALLDKGFFVVAASGLAGYGRPPMQVRTMGNSFVCVGDFSSGVGNDVAPLAPRVMQAAALQADIVITKILEPLCGA